MIRRKQMKMCLNEKNFKITIIFLSSNCSKNRKLSRCEEFLKKQNVPDFI